MKNVIRLNELSNDAPLAMPLTTAPKIQIRPFWHAYQPQSPVQQFIGQGSSLGIVVSGNTELPHYMSIGTSLCSIIAFCAALYLLFKLYRTVRDSSYVAVTEKYVDNLSPASTIPLSATEHALAVHHHVHASYYSHLLESLEDAMKSHGYRFGPTFMREVILPTVDLHEIYQEFSRRQIQFLQPWLSAEETKARIVKDYCDGHSHAFVNAIITAQRRLGYYIEALPKAVADASHADLNKFEVQ